MMKKNTALLGCLCAIGCEVLYGMSYIFTKQATQTSSALSLLGWRFLFAFLLMTILLLFKVVSVRVKGKPIAPLLTVALFCPVIYFIGETVGISKTTASESGVFVACIPVAALIASTLILRKKPAKMQILGIIITLTGVWITIISVGSTSSFSVAGYLSLLIAVISYALYCVYVEKASAFSAAEITYAMLAAGAAVFGTLAAVEAGMTGSIHQLLVLPATDKAFLRAALYGGLGCSVLAFFLSNMAISRIGVNRTASFTGIATVVSVLSGVLALHEQFTTWQIVGAVIIIAGVYTANAKKRSFTCFSSRKRNKLK